MAVLFLVVANIVCIPEADYQCLATIDRLLARYLNRLAN